MRRYTTKYIVPIVLVLAILISSNTIHSVSQNSFHSLIKSNPLSFDSLNFNYSFEDPEISQINISSQTFSEVTITNLNFNKFPGEPKVPVKTISILLPPNSDIDSISSSSTSESIPLSYPIFINEDYQSKENWLKEWFGERKSNENDQLFPSEQIQIVGYGMLRGYRLAFINLYPCQYDYQLNSLVFSNNISFSLNINHEKIDHRLYRDISKDKSYVASKIENPLILNEYDLILNPNNQNQSSSAGTEQYDYIIITENEFEKSFNSLINYKKQYISAKVVNFSFINSNFYGKDLQQKIRECIKYAYINWNTEYVLLGGDISVIPFRGLWGEAIDHEGMLLQDDSIPSDLYYACLDGSWDNDGDEIYGEDSYHSSTDESDLLAEVFIGRAPVENKVEIGTFVNKVISFETSEKPKRILLHQSGLNTINVPDSTIIPEKCAQWIPEEYRVDKLYQVNESISSENWISHFSNNNLIVQHTGNGVYDQYYVSWPTQIFNSYQSLSVLKNDFYPIHTSVACNSGGFDYEDSIAETILLNPYGGASACLFNSRRGFTSNNDAHKYSGEIIEEQFRNMFSQNVNHIGKIQQISKETFATNALTNPAYRWCYYTLNLLGDPEMPVFDERLDYFKPNHFYVDDDYQSDTNGWNHTHFNRIQNAISAANDWDIIHVNQGEYKEFLTIDKTLEIIGQDKQNTIINGIGTITILASRVNIRGFTITHEGYSSKSPKIIIKNSNFITLSDCIISHNKVGINAVETTNLFLNNNTFMYNEKSLYCPIKMGTVYLYKNHFRLMDHNDYGLYCDAKGTYIIEKNVFLSNSDSSFFTCGIYINGETNISSNRFSDCSIGVWLNDAVADVSNNIFSNNNHIALFANKSSVHIKSNSIKYNGNSWISYTNELEPGGIVLHGSGALICEITDNNIYYNKGYGILVKGYFGINNKIADNDFIDNSIHAFVKSSYCVWKNNFWQQERNFPKIIYGIYETPFFIDIPFINIDFSPKSTH